MSAPKTKEEVAAWNDQFARDHDIDDYYARSSVLIRAIEQRRLDIITRMVDARSGDRILEVGCGGGHVLRLFPNGRLTGVDVSQEMIARATRNLAGYDVTLLTGDLEDVGLEEGSFDAVVCTEVLEHVVDPERVLTQIARVARRGARVVITFPNDRLVNGVKSLIRRARLDALPPLRRVNWGGDHYHLHIWSVPEMRTLLSRHFDVLDEAFAPHALFPIRCCFACLAR